MRRFVSFGLIALLVVLGLSAERVLHMYTALDENEWPIYVKAFEKATGIKVEVVRLSSGELLARVEAESKNPRASIWFGGPAVDQIAAKKKGLLAPYKSAMTEQVPEALKDPEGYWVGIYFGAIGFASNTEILKKLNVDPPTSWYDLLKPEFKGKITVAFPYTSGTAYTVLASLVALMGEDAAFDYWKKLDKQIQQYTKSGSAPVVQAGLGEAAVGIAFAHDIIARGIAKGYPLVLTFPKEGTGYEIGAMSLIKGGPEPDLAAKFIDWMLSVEAQNLMKEWYRLPANPQAEVAAGAIRLEEVKLVPMDFDYFGKEKDRLIERWKEEIEYGR